MNVLFLSHRLPYAPNRGDRIRAFHLLKEISRWATVDLASLVHDDEEAGHVADLAPVVRRVAVARVPRLMNHVKAGLAWPTSVPTTHTLLAAPDMAQAVDTLVAERRPDVVLCFCTGIAPLVFRPPLASIPVVLDMVDVDSEKWSALAATSAPPRSWIYSREARTLRVFEARAVKRSAATLVVNERERRDLQAQVPQARVVVVQNGVDLAGFRPTAPPAQDPVVVFCGVMNYEPNIEGVVWMANEVWPAVSQRHPQARFRIVGASPSAAVQALASPARRIEVTGSVPDVRPYLWEAAVSVAPLKTSRGVQNKVLEAVAAGLPTVVTPAVMEGLPGAVAKACTLGDTAGNFASAVVQWLEAAPAERRSHAATADIESVSWGRQLAGLQKILSDAVL